MNNFDLKKYLVENKVTKSSQLEEAKTMSQIGDEIEELEDIKIRYEKKGDYDRAAEIEDKIESLKSEFKNLIKEDEPIKYIGKRVDHPIVTAAAKEAASNSSFSPNQHYIFEKGFLEGIKWLENKK
jgi:hypothetical protein